MSEENNKMEVCAGQGVEPCQVLCREDSVREYLTLINFERSIRVIVEGAQNNLLSDDIPQKFLEIVKSSLDYDEHVELIVKIYRETYDQQTIDALLHFYQSVEGQKFLSHQEDMTAKILKASQQLQKNMVARITRQIEDLENL